jgi:hypothetical protein
MSGFKMRKLPVIQPGRSGKDCTCETEEIELHSCPYSEEIHDDYEENCKCCKACERECREDI